MRKKYLSALLFGALLFASAGTFTSCKDYDDDINNLQTQVTDVKNAVAELQKLIGDGKFVTNVVAENNGLKITWNDGQSTIIENVINGEAQKGDVITFDSETGEILINGEGTGYYASKDAETTQFKAPYVNADGILVLIDEEGKEVVTGIRTAPVTAVENSDGSTTLVLWVDGEKQEVVIPSAASSISEIELLDNTFSTIKSDNKIILLYWNATATTKWEGPRGNIANNTRTYSTNTTKGDNTLYTRIAPVTVDATTLEWDLVNSKNGIPSLDFTVENYDELLTRSSSSNGLYEMTVKAGSYVGSENDFIAQYETSDPKNIRFALKPTTANYKSLFNITVDPSKQTVKDLGNIKLEENSITPVGTNLISKPQAKRQFKVGQEVNVTVEKEYNLYDMYLTVSPEDQALFGIEISEDGRSFKATKSPDNVTDATIDLYVHTLPNAGSNENIKTTTITVEINRTLGEATYEKQTQMPTKVDYSFLVSADKLKESLGDDLNAWYASVKIENVLEGIYDDEACTTASDITAGQLAVTMVEKIDKPVEESNIATKLNGLEFQLKINQTTKPLQIGKTYYALLSFTDKTSNKELNHVIVPFELTKPELSDILVKESGVFRDGNDLAYAYMYWGDAYMDADKTKTLVGDPSTKVAYSRYYIDRAFTDMADNLAKAHMTKYKFVTDDTNKVNGTDKKTSDFATVSTAVTSTKGDARYYVGLKTNVDDNKDGIRDGYKKDLNVKFTGHYLDVNDDSYKYEQTYQFRVMSPILEGEAIAANNLVEVSATGRTKLYKEDIWAKTYNNDVKYNIFKAGKAWYRDDIADVTFSSANKNVFEVTIATPTDQIGKVGDENFVDSYIEVEGVSENTSKLNVAVKDIWGYTLEDQVDIKTTLNLGE